MEDFGLSAFSIFFTQCPSFLAHQKAMQEAKAQINATSFFAVSQIPSDNQIRQMLDPVEPQALFAVYDQIYDTLREHGLLQTWRGSTTPHSSLWTEPGITPPKRFIASLVPAWSIPTERSPTITAR